MAIDKSLVIEARGADLAEYLLRRGEPLVKAGHSYRHRDHDSLVVTNNMYFWNSKQEHGNALDFVMRSYDMSFGEAVKELTGREAYTNDGDAPPEKRKESKAFDPSELALNKDMRRAIAYLTKTRKIDARLVQRLIDQKSIFQEAGTNNLIFPIRDERGELVGAEMNGTLSDVRYKGIKENSKYGYGFNIKIGKPRAMYCFESAIDLLSFIEISKRAGTELSDVLLVSLAGVKQNVIDSMSKAFADEGEALRPVLCVDNDDAGRVLTESVKAKYGDADAVSPKSQYKDWNEQLVAEKSETMSLDSWKSQTNNQRESSKPNHGSQTDEKDKHVKAGDER